MSGVCVVFLLRRSVDRRESSVVFWDLTTQEAHVKHITNLKFLAAAGDYCAVVYAEKVDAVVAAAAAAVSTKAESKDGSSSSSAAAGAPGTSAGASGAKELHVVQLRNAIGAVIDTKRINFTPKYVCMGSFYFAAANDRVIYTWQFQSQVVKSGFASSASVMSSDDPVSGSSESAGLTGKSRERMFDIESIHVATAQPPETFKIFSEAIADPVTCITISDKFLVVARKDGSITRFSLPHLAQESKYTVTCEPYRMELNCSSTKLALIDINGVLSVLDLEARVVDGEADGKTALGAHFGKKLSIEKRDVWDCKWAEDNSEMLCFMEKTKMSILIGETIDEPVVSSGYLGRFKDLEVRVVTLDELLLHPEQPNRDCVIDFETQTLRDARDTIQAKGLAAGYASVDKASHPRLWKLLAHVSLSIGSLIAGIFFPLRAVLLLFCFC